MILDTSGNVLTVFGGPSLMWWWVVVICLCLF